MLWQQYAQTQLRENLHDTHNASKDYSGVSTKIRL
jgi:hypothetical protein